jgi:hypothetical protein
MSDARIRKVMLTMLSASLPGEIIAARDTLVRLIKEQGKDIHTLADRVESNGKLSNAEMQKLYDAGYEAGARAVENKHFGDFHNVDGLPDWHSIARFCQVNRQFVDSVTSRTVDREPTEKQAKHLKKIFYKLGGKL